MLNNKSSKHRLYILICIGVLGILCGLTSVVLNLYTQHPSIGKFIFDITMMLINSLLLYSNYSRLKERLNSK